MHFLLEQRAELIAVRKGEVAIVRPAGVSCQDDGPQAARAKLLLQLRQRLDCELVALRQRGNEAVAAVRAEPDRIAREEVPVVNEVHHMPPRVARGQKAFDLNAVDLEDLPVAQQHLFVVNGHLRQLVEVVDHLAAHLAGEIFVLDLADIELRVPEKAGAVRLHRADMVGVLMGDEDMADGLRVDAEPAHLFLKTVIVVARVDHDGRLALAVEKDVRHPFAHAGDMFIDPAGVQRLEDLLAAVHLAHFLFLKFGSLLGHGRFPPVLIFSSTSLTSSDKKPHAAFTPAETALRTRRASAFRAPADTARRSAPDATP